jgi:hypothetical protein
MKPLIEIANGEMLVNPHAGQRAAVKAMEQSRFVFIIAGTQSGKTSFLPIGAKLMIDKYGPGDYLAVTASYDLYKLKFLPEMLTFFTHYLRRDGWQWNASDRLIIRPRDKTRIILRSANAEGGLESATAKGAILDECGQDDFRIESWEAILRRLALSQGPVLAGTTPYNLGWLKTEVFDRWRTGDPNYRVIQFKSTMNPAFPMTEYERARATMPEWKFQRFYNGEFSRPAGMIYSDFDESIHLVDPFDIPPEWPRYVGIDFGAVHTAVVWIAEDPHKHVYYLYREYLRGEMTTSEHAAQVLAYGKAENVVRYTGGAKSEKQQRWDWSDAGVPVDESPIIDVEAGIDRVIELLKTKRLFIFKTCRGVVDEMGTYSRELDDAGQPTEKIKDKETFHRLDALRYDVSALAPAVEIMPDPFANW